jgi:hypothetical protein
MESVLLQGLAVPYGKPMTDVRDGYRIAFAPGAFSTSTHGRVPLWVNHEKDRELVAAPQSGVFALIDTDRGIVFSALIPRGRWLTRIATLPGRTVRGCSVGWCDEVEVSRSNGVRLIASARLLEVSVMVEDTPAFAETYCNITV